jgi:hypothetical protein
MVKKLSAICASASSTCASASSKSTIVGSSDGRLGAARGGDGTFLGDGPAAGPDDASWLCAAAGMGSM